MKPQHADDVSFQIDMKYGDQCVFDSRSLHRCQYTRTDMTRISTNVRMNSEDTISTLGDLYKSAGRRGGQFAPVHCYSSDILG